MSAINPNAQAAAIVGAGPQAQQAGEDRSKKISQRRDKQDKIEQLHTKLQADAIDSEQELIDQELPDQGQATLPTPWPEDELDTHETSGEFDADERPPTTITGTYKPSPQQAAKNAQGVHQHHPHPTPQQQAKQTQAIEPNQPANNPLPFKDKQANGPTRHIDISA